MCEVQTFNYALTAAGILQNYQYYCALITDGDGAPDLTQFQNGGDPANPTGGYDGIGVNPPATSSGTAAPVIQLNEPINSILQ
jgi:hypothetical protein